MKIVECYDILNSSLFNTSAELRIAVKEIEEAIKLTDWPHGSGVFTIYPEKQANGVTLIKKPCMNYLVSKGWQTEKLPGIINSSIIKTGDLDALKLTDEGYIAFEWETGNISSSHRALNKLFLTMQETNTIGSFLVLPTRKMYPFLTDRIGNISELKPYFPLWKNLTGIKGGMRIIAVEHDEENFSVPKIPKGTDGRARR